MPRPNQYLDKIDRVDLDNKSRKGFLKLDKNENHSGLPKDFVKNVLSEIDPDMLATYPEYGKVKQKIAKHVGLKPENISLSNGSDSSIMYIYKTYVQERDKIITTDPTFAMYPIYSKIFNADTIMIPYKSLDLFPKKEFTSAINKDIKLTVIVNPNNPTGSFVDLHYIEEVIKKAKQYDSIVIVDEAYYYYSKKVNTAVDLVKKYDNLIVLRTFSKLFSMATLRIGYAIADKKIVDNLRKVKPTFDVDGLSVLFAEKILDRDDIINNLIDQDKKGKQYLAEKLKQEGINYKISNANFVLINCKDRVKEIIEKLEKEKILVGGGFKQEYLKNYIRVSTCKEQYMDEFWNKFIKIWRENEQ